MRIRSEVVIPGWLGFPGVTRTALRFTKQERAALERAATILEKARSLVETDTDEDYELARGEHACRELAEGLILT